jgi:DNA-binding LacI/PurR family transcriptional regulator
MLTSLNHMPARQSSTLKTVTLKSIAQTAGVSMMTVSRVLNGSPKVAASTRQQINSLIEQTGYQPDADLLRLMARVRMGKRRIIKATMAVLRDSLVNNHYRYVPIEVIANRAQKQGYRVEEFFLGRNRLTAQRLRDILQARGIEAVIASPPSLPRYLLDFDFNGFASVTFGYGLRTPELHRVSTNMTDGILEALTHLRERGHERIGMAITDWIDRRADHTYSGALLHFQQSIPRKHRIPLLCLPSEAVLTGKADFLRWFKSHKPQALITLDRLVPGWIERDLGLKIPLDVEILIHDWTPETTRFGGIDHRRDEVAKAAVDLLASQLMHHEIGIPEVPRQILIPPRLVIG